MQAHTRPRVEPILRKRLEKWGLPSFGRVLADRATSRLRTTFKKCQPRVGANLLSTWLNKWPTSRRLRGIQESTPCKLCRQRGCEDSLQHIAFCVVTQRIAVELFRLPTSREAANRAEHLERFSCLHPRCGDEELRTRAIFLQVMYYFYLAAKHGGVADAAEAQLDRARLLLSRATRGASKNGQTTLQSSPNPGRRQATADRLDADPAGSSSSRPGGGRARCMGDLTPGGGQLGVRAACRGRVPPPGEQGG